VPFPTRLDLKRDEKLTIEWDDGSSSTWTLSQLRSFCPCARCKEVRLGNSGNLLKKPLLTILPGNYSTPLTVTSAEMVVNYGLRIEWSDGHGSGIYSFAYLSQLVASK